MFELGREHAFAMSVRDLFQLQCAFERDGVGRAVAETVHVVPFVGVEVFGNRFDLRGDHLEGQIHQFGNPLQVTRVASRHPIRQIQKRHDLVGEGLRGRYADFVSTAQG